MPRLDADPNSLNNLGANGIPGLNNIHREAPAPVPALNTPVPEEESAPIDLMRDGAMDDDNEQDSSQPSATTPPKRGIIQTLKTGVVAALGRHSGKEVTTRNAWGKEVVKTLKSRDVFEIEQESFARLRSTETKDKWDPKSVEGLNGWQRFGKGVERFFDRTWRTLATENVHFAKEKKHGMELSAIVGIDSAVSEEFHTVLDQAARKKLAETRQTRTQKFLGGTKDFFQEFFGQERDLHKFKVAEAARLAAEYRNNPADTSHPLYQLINRDTTTREQFAARINESPLELLHQTNSQDKKVEGIKLTGEQGAKVDTFLKKQIIEKAMEDIISRNEQSGDRSGKINAKLRRELDQTIQDYLTGDEFQTWRSTLTEEQQKSYENSFTVASDILLQFEEGMAPAILDNLEHYKGADRLNFAIELSLGTAQMSANTESMGGTYKERHTERASLNEKIWNRTQSKDLHSNEAINTGLKREKLLSAASMIWRNEAVAAFAGAAAGRGVAALARAGFSWLPIVGSAGVAGAVAGLKEWARHGQKRSTYGMAIAEGLKFPDASNAIVTAEMEQSNYHRVGLSERTQRFVDLSNKLGSDNFDNNTILLTMAQIADSGARLKLGNERDINLLIASKDGPEGRGIRNRELRIHDQARAVSTAKVRELLTDPTRLSAIASEMGFTIAAGTTPEQAVDQMLEVLQTSQYNSLLGSTTVSPEVAALVTKVSTLSPDLAYNQLESVRARDKIYNGLRWKSTGKKAATSGAIAGLVSLGMVEYAEAHQTVVDTGTEHQLVPLIDHKLPQHVDPLPTGEIHNPTDGDVLAVMHARVPAGTHLVAVEERVGGADDFESRFNLVTDHLAADGQPEVLVRNMEIGGDGQVQMTTEIRDALLHNHLELKHEALAPVEWGGQETTGTPEIDYTQWDNTLHYKDFPGQDIDAFFAKHINESLAAHPEISSNGETLMNVERVTDINGLRNFMRGMENWVYKQENFQVDQIEGYNRVLHDEDTMWSALTGNKEVISEWQSSTTKILHVPDLLATEEGNRRVVDLIHEAVRENPTGDIHHQFSDEAHRIAWEMSYWGDEAHIPDANETITLLEYFGEIPTTGTVENISSAIPHDISITMTEDFSKVMEIPGDQIFAPGWASVFSSTIGYSRPLEQPSGRSRARTNSEYDTYYAEAGFGKGKRLRDILSFSSNSNGQQNNNPSTGYNQNYPEAAYLTDASNNVEGQKVIEALSKRLSNADRIYVSLGGAVGDAIIGANYVTTLNQGIRALGKNIPITVVINGDHKDLFGQMGPNINVEVAQRGDAKNHIKELVNDRAELAPVIFDFEHYSNNRPQMSEETSNGKTITTVNDLFAPAIQLYNNETDGDRRYTHFIEEILGLTPDVISPTDSRFKVSPPMNNDQVYRSMASRYGIDRSKEQVGIVVEASMDEKRYPMNRWIEVIQKLAVEKPTAEYSIIYNENSGNPNFSKAAITSLLASLPANIRRKIHLVSGTMSEITSVISHQSILLSNDTGLAHLGASLDNGPKVVSLHVPRFSPNLWVSNASKQKGIISSTNDIASIDPATVVESTR